MGILSIKVSSGHRIYAGPTYQHRGIPGLPIGRICAVRSINCIKECVENTRGIGILPFGIVQIISLIQCSSLWVHDWYCKLKVQIALDTSV